MAEDDKVGAGVHYVTIPLPVRAYEVARTEAEVAGRRVGVQIRMDMVKHYDAVARRKGRKL